MVAPSAVVKQTAKTVLKPNYIKSVVCSTVFLFLCIICYLLSGLIEIMAGRTVMYIFITLFIFFLTVPLFYGVLRFFRRMQWGETDGIISIFHYFSSKREYLRVIKVNAVVAVRLGVIGVILLIPAFITDLLQSSFVYDLLGTAIPLWTSNLWVVSIVLFVTALIVLFFVSLRFYIVPFIFVANDDIDTLKAVSLSNIISKRTAFDFFFFMLSFIFWILISILLVPLCFLLPYFIMSYLVHCRFAVSQYNRVVDDLNNTSAPSYSA